MSDEAKPKEARCFALVDADGIVQSEVFFHRRDAVTEAPDWPECRLVEFVESCAISKAEARAETAEATAKSNARAYDQLEDDLKRAESRATQLARQVETAIKVLDNPPGITFTAMCALNLKAWRILKEALAAAPQGAPKGEGT